MWAKSKRSLLYRYSRLAGLCALVSATFYGKTRYSSNTDTFCSLVKLHPPWQRQVASRRMLLLHESCPRPIEINLGQDLLTIAVMYYNDATLLKRHLDHWQSLSKQDRLHLSFLVVDDGSKIMPARRVIQRHPLAPQVHLATVIEDKPWNIGGAMNLAFWLAPTEYVLLLDADIHAPGQFLNSILSLVREERAAFSETGTAKIFTHFKRTYENGMQPKPHPKMMMLSKTSYWAVGGCDEDFVGHYGFTDPHFQWRVEKTPGLHLISVHTALPHIEALLQFSMVDAPPVVLDRSIRVNSLLFDDKKNGRIPWSDKYLRFSWNYTSHVFLR